jgi:EAL domain-containing protein (putative c-di-GMP-specific phosphodiesterase class I)
MLDRVLEAIKIQLEEGFLVVPHSINISRADFDACDIVEEIRKRVDAAGIKRDRITVEITESVIGSNLEFMKAQIERFRKLGFSVWMDDFGSGYSSLNMLKSLPVDVLKIDMNFLGKTDAEQKADTIVKNVINLAMDLGITSLTEGVETQGQYGVLADMGCKLFQGYYFSKPVPTDEFEELVIVKRK